MLKKSGLAAHLQKRPGGPDMPELHNVLSQSLEKRGTPIQIGWRLPGDMSQIVLEVVAPLKGGDPLWCMYRVQSKKRELIFEYKSCDVLLIHNLVKSSCVDAQPVVKADNKTAFVGQGEAAPDASPAAYAERFEVAQEPSIRAYATEGDEPVDTSYTPYVVPEEALVEPAVRALISPAQSYMASVKSQDTIERKSDSVQHKSVAPCPIPTKGFLTNWSASELLQAITKANMTGKLEVSNEDVTAIVYFQDGLPIDATAADVVGDEAIIELLTWTDGQFAFEERVLRNSHTVRQSIQSLLAESRKLSEHSQFLKEVGMLSTSTIHKKNAKLTQLEFIQRVARGAPCDVETLAKFYLSLDGQKSVEEITRSIQISRIQMVHWIHHLAVNDVIVLSNDSNKPKALLTLEPRVVDSAAIQSVMMTLRRADTGMFIYPAFLYFLEQEYFRCYRSRTALSIIIFSMQDMNRAGGEPVRQTLPTAAILDAVLRISKLKRHVDLLAHYDAFDYAMLLPNTKAAGALIFGNRMVKALMASPLGGVVDAQRLSLACGSASLPEDFKDLPSLLGAADLALNQARQRNQPLVMFRDIKSMTVST